MTEDEKYPLSDVQRDYLHVSVGDRLPVSENTLMSLLGHLKWAEQGWGVLSKEHFGRGDLRSVYEQVFDSIASAGTMEEVRTLVNGAMEEKAKVGTWYAAEVKKETKRRGNVCQLGSCGNRILEPETEYCCARCRAIKEGRWEPEDGC